MSLLLREDAAGLEPRPPRSRPGHRPLPAWPGPGWLLTVGAPLAAFAMRLAGLRQAPGADEAGYLMVAGQWRGPGTSLYTNYWVDRPPLLLTVYRLAAEWGGLVPLRLIGAVAVVLTVLGVASTARTLNGPRAAAWASVTAAALLVSPLLDAAEVDGELLAAPFVAWGVAAIVTALTSRSPRRAMLHAALAGALGASALLVKQNFADVFVFALVLLLVAVLRGETNPRRASVIAAALWFGAILAACAVGAWTTLHGTTLVGVYDAMYPFRLRAGRVIAASSNPAPRQRLQALLVAWMASGVGVTTLATLAAPPRRGLRRTGVLALVVTLAFETASVLLGGGYWHHYLIQLVLPVAVLAGLLAERRGGWARTCVAVTVVSSLVAWAVVQPVPEASTATRVGRAIGRSARPGDTVVTLYGHADVTWNTQLPSPYPYLWSLPEKVRDSQLRQLDEVLTGPRAPTWLVTWGSVSSWGLDSTHTGRVVAQCYHRVADLSGHTVYLRDGISRSVPALAVGEWS